MKFEDISGRVIGCAIAVHRALGPGLLESSYQQCLRQELSLNHIDPVCEANATKLSHSSGSKSLSVSKSNQYPARFASASRPDSDSDPDLDEFPNIPLILVPLVCEAPLSIEYKGIFLECGYRVDIVVEGRLLVELKSVKRIEPIHEAQLLTYMKLSRIPVGLLLNFNVPFLKEGMKRYVLGSIVD